jgi:carboxymethylenebutenolidase
MAQRARMTRVNLHAALMTVVLTAAAVTGAAAPAAAQSAPPADEASARVRLEESSRHGEYVDIAVPGQPATVRAFVVYPEIATKAAYIVVVHGAYEHTDWVRGVADQLAADGFIAIAPDLAAFKASNGGDGKEVASADDASETATIYPKADVLPAVRAVHAYGMKLPASNGKTGTMLLQGTPRPIEDWARQVADLRNQLQ